MNRLESHSPRLLALITIAFLALSLIYNVTLPIFEAPDEGAHFHYANWIAEHGTLPEPRFDTHAFHEVTQPALYYALVALVIKPFDRSNLDELDNLNADWFLDKLNTDEHGRKDYTRVRQQYLHTDAEQWPYRGAVWAVRAARAFSGVLGALTLLLVYATARLIFAPAMRAPAALIATSLVAFNPKFISISSTVTNDIAITLTATATGYWLVRLARHATPKRADYFVLGALVGAALLSKLQGLGLLVPALIAVFALPMPNAQARLSAWLIRGAALVLGLVIVSGWWMVWNTFSYGHPLALEQVQRANASLARKPPLSPLEVAHTLPLWFTSFWGNLGIELHFPSWVDAAFFTALAFAAVGLGIALARKRTLLTSSTALALLLIWLGVLAVMFGVWLSRYVGTENARLLMPGVLPIALLVTLGWLALSARLAAALIAALLALAASAPLTVIRPAYALPPLFDREMLITTFNLPRGSAYTVFDDRIELIHAEVAPRRVRPGETLNVVVYWGALQAMPERSYAAVIELVRLDEGRIAQRWAIPYQGRFATRRWLPGRYFRDEYSVRVPESVRPGAARVQISVQLLHTEAMEDEVRAPIRNAPERALLIDRVKIEGSPMPPPTTTPIAIFDRAMQLHQVEADVQRVRLVWYAARPPRGDYTLFIHALDASGQLLAQQDAPPFDGEYPTSLWGPNEVIEETRAFALPPATAQLRLGWYDAQGQRAEATRADGTPWADNVVYVPIAR
ncbi:MAG: glycosyltransferase family 39 protein [Anaerolineae bacterium]|nr:glycosyltransferase family 39 protein [Thermoflexales bacterium]MDW8053165.1 glycosyltransferase family 39 protein [Anaerolineae bacterium]